MNKIILLTFFTGLCYCHSYGQLKKFYSVKNDTSYDTVSFSLKATSGTCFIKPSHHDDPLTIYGNPNFSEVNPSFSTSLSNNTQWVDLLLEDYHKKGLSQAISHSVFGSNEDVEKNYWKVFLTRDKVYRLNLQYGVGDAHVNLSDVSVSSLKLESGSADISLTYDDNKTNLCTMDTLEIKVDLGTVVIDKMYAAKVKYVTTDVGFGTVVMDLKDAPKERCKVKASIGAGKLIIEMPKEGTPVKINFNSSPLCRIAFDDQFDEIEKGVFVNSTYSEDAVNLMTFDLDVALGNIIFKNPK